MDLPSRKIEFVQEFLKIESEEVIARFEKHLINEKKEKEVSQLKPMTKDELNKRIEQSEMNFENGQYKSSDELLAKYQ